MLVVTTPLAPVGLMAIAYLGFLFAKLSQRLNEVTKRARHYRWFGLSNVLVLLAAMSQVMRGTAALAPQRAFPVLLQPWFALVTFHVPLAVGLSLDFVLVWYYWGWVLTEEAP